MSIMAISCIQAGKLSFEGQTLHLLDLRQVLRLRQGELGARSHRSQHSSLHFDFPLPLSRGEPLMNHQIESLQDRQLSHR